MKLRLLTILFSIAIVMVVALQPATADEIRFSEEEPLIYTVVKGDTLWHISGRFFKDPFKWPKLWKFNPYIHNPHLIYPGDVLKITPTSIERVEQDWKKLPTVKIKKLREKDYQEEEVVEMAAPTAAPAPKVALFKSPHLRKSGIISPEEIDMSAAVAADSDERTIMMAADNELFITYKEGSQVREGNTYSIFVIGKVVNHPITGEDVGFLTEDIGTIEITDSVDDNLLKGTVKTAMREIETGALLKEEVMIPSELEIKASTVRVNGYIIAGLESTTQFTEGSLLFIDQGSESGLEPGNLLQIYRDREMVKDPLDKKGGRLSLPRHDIGVMILTKVSDSTRPGPRDPEQRDHTHRRPYKGIRPARLAQI